ncbi:MAG: dethiobiotin synthase [Acidobacteria bacterium]|nr:dethiobiotin synthase [Acidobacteriota bacterium]
MPARGLLITGTDTGVGKTFVGCGLAAALCRRGLRVAPFKPAETGCEMELDSKTLRPADALLLRQATQTGAPLGTICPYRFETPVAPWVAAEQEGVAIDPQRLQECYQVLADSHDWVLVETAGGILVPLTEQFHYGDLARLLHLPVLVVAASRLGVINQTLLTVQYLERAELAVVGCVLNHLDGQSGPAIETNAATLRRLLRHRFHVIPHEPDGQLSSLHPVFDELAGELLR